ncbi:phosphate-starvation-inducible PsiE family protein [Acidiferrobacter thiooxydans]|uniref:phosphate-starvation-inducible PsiE family protein n=1 Tax=Acidiferrobacter thiooxydans TaxID=163359 RepID=UPI003B975B6A
MASHDLVKATGQHLVSDVLSVFILIELFRSFTDYLEFHRIRLQVLAEVGFVFVLRECSWGSMPIT